MQGILVETDGTGARQNLMELCARLGGPFLDVAQVKKLMLRHDGCVALKANTWSESTFTVLQSLPVEQRGAYCVLKTVELVYLLCSVPFPVSWTVKMKKKQKETQDILSYHTQAAGCSDKARAKASGGRQPIEECGRTGL